MSPNSNEEVAPHENVGNPSGQFDREGSVERGDFGSGARRYFDSRDQIEHEYYDRRRGPAPEGDRRGSVCEFRMDVDGEGPYGSYRGTYGRRFGSFEPHDGPRREDYYGYGRSDRFGRSSYGYDRSVSPFGRGYDYGMDGGYGYGDQDRYGRDYYGYGSDYGRRGDFGRSQYGRGFGDYNDQYGYGYSGRPYGFDGGSRHSFGDDYGRYGYGGDYGRYGHDSYGYGRYGHQGDQDKYGYGGDYGRYGYSRHGYDRDYSKYGRGVRYGYEGDYDRPRSNIARNEYDTDYSRYSHGSQYDRYGFESDYGRYGYGYNVPRNYEQYSARQHYGRGDQGRYGRGMVGDDSYRGYYRDQSPYGYNRYGYRSRSGERDFRGSRSYYDQYRRSPYSFGQNYPFSRQGYGGSSRFPQDRFNFGGRYSKDSWNRDNRYGYQGYRSPYNYNAGPTDFRRRHFGRSEFQQPFPFSSQESFRN